MVQIVCLKNKMRVLVNIFVFLLISMSVNAQLKKFTVEIPSAPKFEMPDSIQSLTIMNRSISPEFTNFGEDSLQSEMYKRDFRVSSIILDSQVADTTVRALGEFLFDSERFDVVIPVDRNIPRYLKYSETPSPLDWAYVQSLCSLYNTDALLVLENFATKVVANYKKQKEYIEDGFYATYYASIDLYYRAHWRVYEPKSKTILVDYVAEDTLYWDGYELNLNELFGNLPKVKEACIEAGIRAAADFSGVIAPAWNNESRYYYVTKDQQIDTSLEYAADGDWDSALNNWMKYVKSGSLVQRSKVMFNVALANEMLGNLDSAIDWLQQSQRAYYREVTNYYLKKLIKRKEDLSK
jgi:hypothetical protein